MTKVVVKKQGQEAEGITEGYTANVNISGVPWTEKKNGNLMSTATYTWQDAMLYATEEDAMLQSKIIANRLARENAVPFVCKLL